MLGLRPTEFMIVVSVLALAAAYDFSRTEPEELAVKRLRMALYGLAFLVSVVMWKNSWV